MTLSKSILRAVSVLACFGSLQAHAAELVPVEDSTKVPSKGEKSVPKIIDPRMLDIQADDVVMGDPKAPVTIIEYSSLSCPHCAHFHNDVYKNIKSKYILNGKVKYVIRDFPLNSAALLAAKIAHCGGNDRYFDFVGTLFEWQDMWAFTREYMYPLEKIAKLGGLTDEKYKECTTDKKIEDFILNRAMKANNALEIDQTPTFFINGERFGGAKPYSFYEQIIEKKLSGDLPK
jgi:protein-disulfide isomerase